MVKRNKPKPPLLLLDTDSRNNRVMTQLRDSLLSQLTQLHPSLPPSVVTRRSSFIQSRLQKLFHSFHTPTHPPYALMINRAVAELSGGNGSTEEAISEFVKREYEDLPWAHSKILSVHLKRLCEVGELRCNVDGKYVFPVGDEEEKERREYSKKKKRSCRRSTRLAMIDSSAETDEASTWVSESDDRSIGSVDEEQIEIQSRKEIQCLLPNELEESQSQEEKERCKNSRKKKKMSGRRSTRLAQLDSSAGADEASTQVSESNHRSMGSVEEQIQIQSGKEIQCLPPNELEESQTQEEKERCKNSRKRKRSGRRSTRSALLDSCAGTDETSTQVSESDHHSVGRVEEKIQIQSGKEIKYLPPNELEEPQTQVNESNHRSMGSVEEQIQIQSGKEIQCLPPNELEESQTQMVSNINCAVGSPECIISTGPEIELSSPTQLQLQISADIDMDTTAGLICVNVDDELPQDYNQEEKEMCKNSRKTSGRRSTRLALLDSCAGTDEASTQVSEGDHHSIGSVEEQIQIQSGKEIQCLPPKELEESQTQMVSNIICAEGSPECIISTSPGIELSSPTQLQPQMSTDIETDVTAALISANMDDELPQDYDQGNTNGNLVENPKSECLELEPIQPKRKRGRPRKSETGANCQKDSLLLKQGPKRNKKKQDGPTRGRGRPRKVIQDTEQCEEKLKKKEEKLMKEEEKLKKKEEKLKKKDQGKLCGREKKLKGKDKAKLCDHEEELYTEDQAKLYDREEKLNKKDQAKLRGCGQGRGQGRGRGRGRGRGQGRPHKPKVCDTIAEAPPAEVTAM